MDLVVHASDVSFLARPNDVQVKWLDGLFEQEFFKQGDFEKE